MIYNSWTVQPNISLRLSSVPHECWGCIETFLGFLRIFNVKLCPRRVMAYHGWEPLFEGMCHMHGMCFDMLTPMLYISVCRKIYSVIRGKGLAHVPMVNSIALD